MSRFTLHQGDCLATLRTLADNSVDAIVTDPPYGLSFMGKKWDYDVPTVEVWVECLRVLKPGGHLLAFAGTRTQHRMATRIEAAGFELRDMIAWVYGSGFPKSHNGEWGGTALKPAFEPITMARKPLAGTVEANWRQHGTGALNIDGCRVEGGERPLIVGENDARKFSGDFKQGSRCEGTTTAGRWPANLIHDGSDEVVTAFEPQSSNPEGQSSNPARFFYCAKASKRDRDEGLEGFDKRVVNVTEGHGRGAINTSKGGDGIRENRPRANIHPTVKPTDLMRYLCRLVTPPGGVVLDPFMGSGSTGKAAMLEGFRFVGCELSPEYLAIAEARIAAAQPAAQPANDNNPQADLFGAA